MKPNQKILLAIRILLSGLFLLSVFAKFYPSPSIGVIKYFEQGQLIDVLGFNEAIAPFLSRMIIAFELFLSIALLQTHYLKKVVIPLATLLLLGFSIHLTILIFQGSASNCGCFGELIPMTPLQALIKNILTICILAFLYVKTKPKEKSNNWVLPSMLLATTVFMFLYVPLDAKEADKVVFEQKLSVYSKYVEDIDQGEKLLCFFVPGCDHCQAAAKEITALSTSIEDFPEVHIVFMDEEAEKIPEFFKIAGKTYPYQVMDIHAFIEAFWKDGNETPGVVYLNNGNIIQFYQGSEESGSKEAFNAEQLKTVLEAR